jgi:hypothetical protein
MGGLITTPLGCIASGVSSCLCSAAGSSIGHVGKERAPRVPYMLLMFISIVVSVLLKYFGSKAFLKTPIFEASICTTEACTGNQAVLRMTFALAMFFLVTFMISLGTVNTGKYFGLQVVLLAGLMVMSFFLNNSVFIAWAGIARFLSAIFLLCQLMLIIDFAYIWNENWVAKDKREYYLGILAVSVVMLIVCIVFWVLFFKWFAKGHGCDLESFFISFTIIICVGSVLLAISNYVEKGGILPASFVAVYSTYLLFVALKNDSNGTCNTLLSTENSFGTASILGLLVAAASIVYSTWSLGTSSSLVQAPTESTPLIKEEKACPEDKTEQKKDLESDATEVSDGEYVLLKKQNTFFHGTLVLASAYAGMLLTNWGINLHDTSAGFNTAGPQVMWVNIGTQWVCIALFVWTLIAPKCCANRDWD